MDGREGVREREVDLDSFLGSLGKGEVGLGVAGIGRRRQVGLPNEIDMAGQ